MVQVKFIKVKFIDHVTIKVDVANTHWVMYILVSNIPAHLQLKKTNANNL